MRAKYKVISQLIFLAPTLAEQLNPRHSLYHVSVDSTTQEKNITHPTDAKLHKKIVDQCVKKAKKGKNCFA
ncbi:hypothetical protein ED312_03540 [Sinomicrobium pectinilyticum]|uniref:Uncharacterized protein n=1 Tax=Sinomicrobium pectinilyticum TaxID=1084421 RepID=A0A3N0EXJ4_SINP1|nr:hypothetical protein [Sinomicrobium pectinilyticum]RNL92625.1 hypothetical protein ED312_03540 [Sinomicrobium pectinilyticum]